MPVKQNLQYPIPRPISDFETLTGAPVYLNGFQETCLVYLMLNGSCNTATVADDCRRSNKAKTRKRETLRYLKLMKDMGLLMCFERPFHDQGFIWSVSALGEQVALFLLKDPYSRAGNDLDLQGKLSKFCPSLD